VFLQRESQWAASPRKRIRLRSLFLGGKLLETLGSHREAIKFFEELVAEDLHHELFKDALLDLLYLFGFFVRLDDAEGAIAVCNRAIRQMKALDLGHEQLYAVWNQLMEIARVKALGSEGLTVIKEYLRLYWRHPAPQAPKLGDR
jgi:tetratricopeptide (TPR) repeat protein